MPREEDFSRFDDSPSLIGPDGPFELFRTQAIPGLHFREGDDAVPSGHDVYLAAFPAQVAREDGPALGLEAGGRRVLAETPLGGAAFRDSAIGGAREARPRPSFAAHAR